MFLLIVSFSFNYIPFENETFTGQLTHLQLDIRKRTLEFEKLWFEPGSDIYYINHASSLASLRISLFIHRNAENF